LVEASIPYGSRPGDEEDTGLMSQAGDIFRKPDQALHDEIKDRWGNENKHDEGAYGYQSQREISQFDVGIAIFH
jgi:hypothetical protein